MPVTRCDPDWQPDAVWRRVFHEIKEMTTRVSPGNAPMKEEEYKRFVQATRPRLCQEEARLRQQAAAKAAARYQGNYRLPGSTLFVTLEPCLMCLGAILHARVSRVVFGAYDPRAGKIASVIPYQTLNQLQHKIQCEGGV